MPSTPEKIDFFISYNKADKAWAEWIAWELEVAGYTTILQAWDFRPGSDFILEMQKATSQAERTIAVFSQNYLDAEFTHPEWAAAFAKDPKGEKGSLLIVKVADCQLEGMLAQRIYISLIDLAEPAARQALLDGVKRGRRKPPMKPGFPGKAKARSVPEQPRFPGSFPPIWNVHNSPSQNFTGREALLATLRQRLTSGQPTALTQAVKGMGGIGKTQLALKYAYSHKREYELVWWLRAEEPATLAADYAALEGPLGLGLEAEPNQSAIVDAVRSCLQKRTGWLLIFDNVPAPKAIAEYLPPGGTGHVIITSQHQSWRGVAQPLDVNVMELGEAVDLLQKRSGKEEPETVKELAEELGRLPLALEQAGAYVDENGISLAAYLYMYQTRRVELGQYEHAPDDYEHTVATTWSLSLESLQEKNRAAIDLLSLLAFMGPDNFPRDIIEKHAEELPDTLQPVAADPLALNDAVAALRSYSLITTSDGSFTVHRLVQIVVRDRLAAEGKADIWAAAAVEIVNVGFHFKSDDVTTWPGCSRLVEHGLVAVVHTETQSTAIEATGNLLHQMGLYFRGRAAFKTSRKLHERGLILNREFYGPDDSETAIGLGHLGGVLQDLGDLKGARENHERALEIFEQTHEPDHPFVASGLSNLGVVLSDLGNLKGARKNFERALKIDENVYGPDHPMGAIRLNNLGSVLHDLGDLKGARQKYERALEIDIKVNGPNHPTVAIRLSNLGSVLYELNDFKGAQKNFERALEINERVYGPDHPNVAICLCNLGSVLHSFGDLQGARKNHERAVQIDKQVYGLVHPRVAADLNNLGTVLHDLDDLEGARETFARALEIDEKFYGLVHPKVAIRLNNLGSVLLTMGDLLGARRNGERALKIFRDSLGDEHPETVAMMRRLEGLLELIEKDGA